MSLARRGSDLLVAAAALLLAAPLLLVVVLILRWRNGRLLLIRELHENGNGRWAGWWRFHPALAGSGSGGLGAWFQRSRLDRLPRLFNVLAGEATVFGPRVTPSPAFRPLALIDTPALSRATFGLGVRLVSAVLQRIVPYRWAVVILTHVLLIAIGYRLALELRFDFDLPPIEAMLFWQTLPLLLVPRVLSYWYFGLDRGYWKHFGVEDLFTLCKAAVVGSVGFLGGLYLTGLAGALPRSVWLLEATGAIGLAGGVRLLARSVLDLRMPGGPARRALVIGVGNKAERVLREVRRDHGNVVEVVGVVADAIESKNRSLHGVTILGTVDELETLVQRCRVTMLIVALDAPSSEQMQRTLGRCLETGVEFRILPSLHELLQGADRIAQLRRVRIEDLLGRDPVEQDLAFVRSAWRDKVVLITGGAGSIGSELARQIARCAPAKLVLLDQAESPLYFTMLEIAGAHPGLELVPVVCDVTDEARLAQVFADHQPHCVIHAAAYKHVPMLETNVVEAVHNNVLGTLLTVQAAATWGAERFILISTDKAVNPSSVMGATKRIAERLIFGLPRLRSSGIDLRAVRFGNVLGSAGSVVPLFEQQIAAGGPVTVTHPEVERYFMTIPEAAHLVLQAGTLPEAAGRISMLDMGRPVRILDLAEKLIRLSGQEPYRDISISFTGLRPGEKLTEELMSAVEATVPTTSRKIRIVQTAEEPERTVMHGLDRLLAALKHSDANELISTVVSLVPECVSPLRARPRGPRPRLLSPMPPVTYKPMVRPAEER